MLVPEVMNMCVPVMVNHGVVARLCELHGLFSCAREGGACVGCRVDVTRIEIGVSRPRAPLRSRDLPLDTVWGGG